MSLNVTTRFPGGNAAGIEVGERDGLPEVRFASDPCGGTEALWFYFRIEETAPSPSRHTKIRLTWTLVENVTGGNDLGACIPVASSPGHTWSRLKQGEETRTETGLREISWQIPHPAPSTEVAFCFPYGRPELENALSRSKDFWRCSSIGISQGGRALPRLYNTPGMPGGTHPGLYLVARQHAGETPGSWVLDGFLRQLASHRKGGHVIWCVPLADIDGVEWGWYGRENLPQDLDRAWSDPPMRHEALAIRNDLLRWKERCRPALVLDFHAPGAFDRDGVFVYADTGGPTGGEETKWCNVISNDLKPDYAANEFQREDRRTSRSTAPSLVTYVRRELGIPALGVQVPYAQAGANTLVQKNYREIGQRIAQAILRRKG